MTSAPPQKPHAGLPPKPRSAVVRDALGVGAAVGLSGFAFGVTSAGAGMTLAHTCVLSLLVFTGASQFALVGALGAGGAPLPAAAGALLLGVRNAFYGLRLSQVLGLPAAVRPLAAHWVIDETSAVALAQPDRRLARLGFTVTGVTLYAGWNVTTLLGALGAAALGDPAAWGLDVAGPAVFLALLLPMLRDRSAAAPSARAGATPAPGRGEAGTAEAGTATSRPARAAVLRHEVAVAVLAVLLALACVPFVPAGVPVLVAVLAAPAVLAVAALRSRAAARRERSTAARAEEA
ncbi:AzlC family ABC transporter permease [Microbispora triticiradicis]|uniref:AzlC family ABC transporter permease n=1 Tax=Microbispora triticiradicis TaxID=2200763 RepID=UPI0027DBF579|nr:AzlC family ABC transporter permease [Microbispora triticiradicis]MBO4273414.1 branched-chain amino acid ABC transporter permease [Microbispora triticiradicis]